MTRQTYFFRPFLEELVAEPACLSASFSLHTLQYQRSGGAPLIPAQLRWNYHIDRSDTQSNDLMINEGTHPFIGTIFFVITRNHLRSMSTSSSMKVSDSRLRSSAADNNSRSCCRRLHHLLLPLRLQRLHLLPAREWEGGSVSRDASADDFLAR